MFVFSDLGGVITDATAIPEDVINGQVFYNNDGRQVGTNNSAKRIQTQIYVIPSGIQLSLGRVLGNRTVFSVDLMSGSSSYDYVYTARDTTYIVDFMSAVRLSSISSSSITYNTPTSITAAKTVFMPIKHLNNLNIQIENIDNIQIGSNKYVIGTSREITSSVTSVFKETAYAMHTNIYGYWMKNNTITSDNARVYVSFHYEMNPSYPTTILTDIVISVSCDNWSTSYSSNVSLSSPIPIVINTYAN